MDQIDFLQQVALRASELQASIPRSETREWKLNYKMLFNPKLHCPFCEEWIESGRVWMVDEAERCVKRVWKLDGTHINVDGCHPHVGAGGRICMGSARSTSDALVAGIAGSDDFVRAWDWFPEELGHSCPNLERAAEVGQYNRHADDPFEDDHDGEAYCDACEDYYPEEDVYFCDLNESRYCDGCWADRHDSCENCGDGIHTHDGESSYEVEGRYGTIFVCEYCYNQNYFTCTECDKGLRNEKHQEYGICVDCWEEDHFRCSECEEWKDNGSSSDLAGVCNDCSYRCEDCRNWFVVGDLSHADNSYCEDCWDKKEEASDGE